MRMNKPTTGLFRTTCRGYYETIYDFLSLKHPFGLYNRKLIDWALKYENPLVFQSVMLALPCTPEEARDALMQFGLHSNDAWWLVKDIIAKHPRVLPLLLNHPLLWVAQSPNYHFNGKFMFRHRHLRPAFWWLCSCVRRMCENPISEGYSTCRSDVLCEDCLSVVCTHVVAKFSPEDNTWHVRITN